MKIAALCCTYLRPQLLGELIECFARQDYPAADRELLVLDDAGQYDDQQGPGWRLLSLRTRLPSLGVKRNMIARMAGTHVDAYAIWDDDDIYLPWALSATVAALREAPWSQPGQVLKLDEPAGCFRRHDTFSLRPKADPTRRAYQGGWGFRRQAFWAVGGYDRALSNGEDRDLANRLKARFGPAAETITERHPDPFYWYRGNTGTWHISGMGPANAGYEKVGEGPWAAGSGQKVELTIGWRRDYTKIPIDTEVLPRGW